MVVPYTSGFLGHCVHFHLLERTMYEMKIIMLLPFYLRFDLWRVLFPFRFSAWDIVWILTCPKREIIREIFASWWRNEPRKGTHLKSVGWDKYGEEIPLASPWHGAVEAAGFIHKNELTAHPCYMLCWVQCPLNGAVTRSPCAELLEIYRGCPQRHSRKFIGQYVALCQRTVPLCSPPRT